MQLLDEGATVPFVSRYRKEVTGNLDEIEIGKILESVTYLRNLEKRKRRSNQINRGNKGNLQRSLKRSIEDAEKLQEVEGHLFPL